MPFSLFRPKPDALRRLIASQTSADFTYPSVGASAALDMPLPLDGITGTFQQSLRSEMVRLPPSALPLPPSFTVDHTRVHLGHGQADFEQAKAALARWEEFNLGWLHAFPPETPLCTGETVAVVARVNGIWCTNLARIVYLIDDEHSHPFMDGTQRRFGFGYGTLPAHVEMGEERFLIEWDLTTDTVWFDIVAFSRPRHILVRANRRQARALQRRFGLQAATAMQGAVLAASPRTV